MTGRFNLQDYETVDERNGKFWAKYPDGRLVTDLVFHDGTRYVFRCEAYTNRDDPRPAATGHAEEYVSAKGVNATSALENCETSAEGRALARLGFAPKGARPSREEMQKATRVSPADQVRLQLKRLCAEKGWEPARVAAMYASDYDANLKTDTNAERIAGFMEILGERADQLKAPAT